jgi:hypothetical protein
MITRIYSCGGHTTANDLMASTDVEVDHWFPELYEANGLTLPRLIPEIMQHCHDLYGQTIVTTSEIIILWFLREVRHGQLKADDLELYCDNRRIRVDDDGELIDRWTDGFFRERANLLFD